jgi:uncharacterized protein (DUF58 family)
MIKNPRSKLREVMQRALLLDISELKETELLRGAGRRESSAKTYSGLGKMESIVEWTSDYPYNAINWGLSAQTSPRKRLVVKRTKLINTDWCVVVDCSQTMNFGTVQDLKLVTALQLAATFAQSGIKKRDRVKQIIINEKRVGLVLDDASAEEMVLMALRHDPLAPSSARLNAGMDKRERSGLSMAVTQLPENQAIVPVISDFMNMTDADKEQLVRASGYHTVLCCVVEDAREIRFPEVSGQITLQDMKSGRRETMTFAQANALVSQDRAKRIADLVAFFRKARIPYAFFEAGEKPSTTRLKLVRLMQAGA